MTSVEVIETWEVVDRWWTDSPIRRAFADVWWAGSRLIFVREGDDRVWRVATRARGYSIVTPAA